MLLRELLSLIDAQSRSIAHLEQELERRLAPLEEQIERCARITGVSRQTVQLRLSEVGSTLSRFPAAEHLSRLRRRLSWAEGACRQTTQRAE